MDNRKKSKYRQLDAVLLEYSAGRNNQIDSNEAADYILDNELLPNEFYRDAKRQKVVRLIRSRMEKGVLDQDGNLRHFSNFIAEISNDNGGWVQQQFYKDDRYLSVEQCIYQMEYCKDQSGKYKQRFGYYENLAITLHGPDIQGMLPGWE